MAKSKFDINLLYDILSENKIEFEPNASDIFKDCLIYDEYFIHFASKKDEKNVNNLIDVATEALEKNKKYLFIPTNLLSSKYLSKIFKIEKIEKEFKDTLNTKTLKNLAEVNCLVSNYYLIYFELLYKFDRKFLIQIFNEIRKILKSEEINGRLFKIIPYGWHKYDLIIKGLKGEIYETDEPGK